MKPQRPCLNCGVAGPWKNDHGVRCPRCAAVRERERAAAYRPLRLIPPEGPCRLCGSKEDLTWDHRVPLAKGGKSVWSNLQVLCRPCNSAKKAK